MEDKQAKAREIIENAMAQAMAMGMEKDDAAALLIIQGAIRIESKEKLKEMARFVAEAAEEPIDG